MKLQVIQDGRGRDTGVFIPMEDWDLIKSIYPGITRLSHELPQWQKDLIDERLEAIAANPKRIKPIKGLFHKMEKFI